MRNETEGLDTPLQKDPNCRRFINNTPPKFRRFCFNNNFKKIRSHDITEYKSMNSNRLSTNGHPLAGSRKSIDVTFISKNARPFIAVVLSLKNAKSKYPPQNT
ncbi:uncharacterized protein DFL_006576 [Arthrobotrys flagrans]|uniref:Uncharacterized protein n=1 Tax=Arthrobotrys flagrans TaxID=97331 RepID=A0A436ZTH4_ARTFL|nr:hypothetical protein DFL_006576 [Arthrobotrys flagrans]